MRLKNIDTRQSDRDRKYTIRYAILKGRAFTRENLVITRANLRWSDFLETLGHRGLDHIDWSETWQEDRSAFVLGYNHRFANRSVKYEFSEERWPSIRVQLLSKRRDEDEIVVDEMIVWWALPGFFDRFMEWRPEGN